MSTQQRLQLRTAGKRSPKAMREAREEAQRNQYLSVMKTGMTDTTHQDRMKKYMEPQRFLSATKTGGGAKQSRRRSRRRSPRRRKSTKK